ncbi:MAG: amino acid adenylation protein, partial [Acidobacteria bacterium]|nr:amino acid adenylation protein [Acidobacteriota bacterium]
LAQDLMLRTTLLRLAEDEHVLLLTLHHIAADGWSVEVLVREFQALYKGEALAPLPIQYADYAAWQLTERPDVTYWTSQLADLPPVHGLPLDKPRPAQQSFSGGTYTTRLSRSWYQRLTALARQENATPFMLLQTAFALLLGRWSNSGDIVMGSPIAGRNHKDVEPLIGFFVNTLVLRTALGESMTFAELLSQNRQTIVEAFAHQEVSFEALVGELEPERSLSYSPLFQILFTLRNEEGTKLTLPGLEVSELPRRTEAIKFDLQLDAVEDGEGLELTWSYADALFEETTIARLGSSFEVLLGAIADDAGTSIHKLPLLTGGDRAQLAQWSVSEGHYPSETLVHELVEAQAARTPEAMALVARERTLTYHQLNEQANQVAHALVAQGIGLDELVGISMQPSIEMLVAILGIVKAGAAYVPLSPSLPSARLEQMIADAGVRIVLRQDDRFATYPSHNLGDRGLTPANLVYVLYTSGTTGQPKGVMISHGAGVNFATGLLERLELKNVERWLMLTALSFDIAFFEWFGCLQSGGSLYIADEIYQTDAAELRRFLESNHFHLIQATPSRWTQLLDAGWQGEPGLVALAGGEPLTLALQEKLSARVGTLWNGYGPTEATVYSCNHRVDPSEAVPQRLSIGQGLRNYRHQILSAYGEPVPIGAIGELHIGGPSLARGYLNQPELTSQKFIGAGEGRLYKSGDLVRYLPGGEIAYIGRSDDQVKVRGFRIELGEIEAQLRLVAGVRDGVVLARGVGAHKYLAAYLVGEAEVSEVRAALKSTLPDYMVPTAFVRLECFPLNASGKIDKKSLPEPERQAGTGQVAPSGETEERVARIWSEVLELDAVSVEANFFELGGHSLLATRIASALSAAFGRTVPVRALFEHNTVRSLSAYLDQQSGTRHQAIPLADRSKALPLSFAQQRLWFIDQLEGGSAQYNMPAALRLKGTLDRVALQHAFDTIVARHEVLRTRFKDGAQVIGAIEPVVIHELEATSGEVAQLAEEEASKRFDLAQDLMLRTTLLRLAEDEHVLLLTLHHIAADGWSVGVLIEEFTALYGGYSLPALETQYADFAAWQRAALQGEAFERQLAYWRHELEDLPPVHSLPLDKPRPAQQSFAGDTVVRTVDPALVAQLHALGQGQRATLFMVLQSAFALLVGRWSRSSDVVIGSPVAGREHGAVEPLIGFFVNTLVLRTRLAERQTFRDLLEATKRTAVDAYAHQSIPFEALVDALNPERSLSHGALFQLVFSDIADRPLPTLAGLELSALGHELPLTKFDLNLIFIERPDGLQLRWDYATSLFERETVEQMAASYETLLRAIIATPERSIYELPLTSGNAAPQADRPFPEETIQALFEARALHAPEAVAVIAGDDRLTYRELNARANQLAHVLLGKGVAPGELVALCATRSLDTIVGTLAILKAGAAYLPLDPSYPEERSRYMVEDGRVRFLLTQLALLEQSPLDLVQVVVVDMPAVTARAPRTNPERAGAGSDLAYVMYTSGSTGQPKGVMVEHRGVIRLVIDNHYAPLNAGTRMLQAASVAFDAATFEIWGALLNGGCLVLYPDDLLDLAVLNDTIQEHGVNTMWLTAGLFEQWSQSLPRYDGIR